MKNNEMDTSVASPETTNVSQTPVVEQTTQPVTDMQQKQPPITAQPMNNPVQTTQSTPGLTPAAGSNAFADIIAKLKSVGVVPIVTIGVIAIVLVAAVVITISISSPKSVFKNAINSVYKGANTAIDGYETYLKDYDITENPLLISGDFKLETNVEELDDYNLNKLSLEYNAGIDYKKEIISLGASLKGSKEKIELNAQMLENGLYVTSSLFDEVLKLDSDFVSELGLDIDFEELKEEIKTAQKEYDTNPETYEYIVKTIRNALSKSIDQKYMEKEKDEIEVLNKELKVTKYSYILDEDAVQDLVKNMVEYLLEDKDFTKTLADACGVDKKDIKELLKEMKSEAKDIELDDEISINIYTRGIFNAYAGFGVEVDNKEYISIYTDGKNAELIVDDHNDGAYGTKIVATMEKEGKGYNVEVKENKETLIKIKFNELTDDTIDAKIDFYDEGEKEGTIEVYLNAKESKKSFTGEYKFKITEAESKEYVGFSGKYTLKFNEEIKKNNVKNAISADELDLEKVEENIKKISEKDEALGTLIEDSLSSLEEELLDLNYNGMVEIKSLEVEKVLKKQKATVLYVGSSYYSLYSKKDEYNLLNNLIKLQTELDFYSYYLSEFYVSSDFETLVKDVQYVCPTTTPTVETPLITDQNENNQVSDETNSTQTCTEYPAIYLIKDGNVVKAFRKTVSYEDLKSALSEIGIK